MGGKQIEEKNITKLNVMMICILQNHVCETIAVAAKSCYKYSGLPAYPLKVDFIVTLFFSILSSIESHFCISLNRLLQRVLQALLQGWMLTT